MPSQLAPRRPRRVVIASRVSDEAQAYDRVAHTCTEIGSVNQRDFQPSARCIDRYTSTGRAASYDQQIKLLRVRIALSPRRRFKSVQHVRPAGRCPRRGRPPCLLSRRRIGGAGVQVVVPPGCSEQRGPGGDDERAPREDSPAEHGGCGEGGGGAWCSGAGAILGMKQRFECFAPTLVTCSPSSTDSSGPRSCRTMIAIRALRGRGTDPCQRSRRPCPSGKATGCPYTVARRVTVTRWNLMLSTTSCSEF